MAFLRVILILLILFSTKLPSEEQLHRSDIQKIMEQIFSQHIDKKAVSVEIIKNSFRAYIENFDPEGIYLLQSEVVPYFDMDRESAETIEKQYRQGDYTPYEKLNTLIQNSIERSRVLRSQIEQNPRILYSRSYEPLVIVPKGDLKNYPYDENSLREETLNHMRSFFQSEMRRYGEKGVLGYETQTLNHYERHMRNWEDAYLYRDDNGELLSDDEQENLFAMHVLKAIAKSLDAHTAFYDSNEAYDLRVRLEKGFEGIGIVFQETAKGIVVGHLIEGGPAMKEGQIKVGDFLKEINGISTENMPFEKILTLLRGEKDQPISLVFKRSDKNNDDKIIPVTLKRDLIVLNDDRVEVNYEQFGNGIIGRITLHSFYDNDQGVTSEKDVRAAIKALDREGNLRGLILDLRENSGGFLSQAVKVAGLFITNGVVVISKYANGDQKIYRDTDSRVAYKGPLIVLTSKATASAAEIVAQALQDYGVALIVGDEQTYGKGTIQSQTVTDNKAGSYFKVTVGKYYTVSGKTPQLKGVAADIVVPGPFSQARLGEEYLEHPLSRADAINDSYKDALKDIDPGVRPWYLNYYVPTLQRKNPIWGEMLPELKKNSSYRLEHNKNYQIFLKQLSQWASPANPEPLEEGKKSGNFGISDLQLAEAMNVLKDMIYLQAKNRHQEYLIGSEK